MCEVPAALRAIPATPWRDTPRQARRGNTPFVALVVLAPVGLMIATAALAYWLIAAIIKLLETSVLQCF